MKKAIEYKITAVKNNEFESTKITNSTDASKYMRQFFFDDILIYESFFILLLNRTNRVTGWAKISQGGITGTVADPKIIAKYIVDSFASSVMLCHNHPSGNTTPSQQDIDLTKKIKEMAKLFECTLLDHVILTEESYYSFADNGILN